MQPRQQRRYLPHCTAALPHQIIILQSDFLVDADLLRGALRELMTADHSTNLASLWCTRRAGTCRIKTRRLIDYPVQTHIIPRW